MERTLRTEFTIRSPRVDDARAISSMHSQSWEDTYVDAAHGVTLEWIRARNHEMRLSPAGLDRRREMIEESQQDPAYLFKIAVDSSGSIVGFIDGRREGGAQWLLGLYTDKKTHGSGLGNLLMKEFDAWVSGGAGPAKLQVAKYNSRAIRFYEKHGFEILPNSKQMFADTIETLEMIRHSKGDNDEI